MHTQADFSAQLGFLAEVPRCLFAFFESRIHGKPYAACREFFSLDVRERERFAAALASVLGTTGEDASVLLFLALLIAAQAQRLDALLLMEPAYLPDPSAARMELVAGVAYIFAPALILSILIFGKKEKSSGK